MATKTDPGFIPAYRPGELVRVKSGVAHHAGKVVMIVECRRLDSYLVALDDQIMTVFDRFELGDRVSTESRPTTTRDTASRST